MLLNIGLTVKEELFNIYCNGSFASLFVRWVAFWHPRVSKNIFYVSRTTILDLFFFLFCNSVGPLFGLPGGPLGKPFGSKTPETSNFCPRGPPWLPFFRPWPPLAPKVDFVPLFLISHPSWVTLPPLGRLLLPSGLKNDCST